MVSQLNTGKHVQCVLLLSGLLLLCGCGSRLARAAEDSAGMDESNSPVVHVAQGPTVQEPTAQEPLTDESVNGESAAGESADQVRTVLAPVTLKQVSTEAATKDPAANSTSAVESATAEDAATETTTQTMAPAAKPVPVIVPRIVTQSVNAIANATTSNVSTNTAVNDTASISASSSVMPDRITIPAIEMDTSVVELGWHAATDANGYIFSEWDVARYAAGWHKNSAQLGEEGNLVLSGHNNILGAVFRELDRLKKGDEAVLWANGEEVRYTIDQVMIVPEKYASPEQRLQNASWIEQSDDTRLTLVSCWPRNDNSHRIIVVAYPNDAK